VDPHRVEAICNIISTGLDEHGANAAGLAAYLRERNVTKVDLAEALEDVDRLPPGQAQEASDLLRLTLERLGASSVGS
jgi:hypothetical protein